MSHQTETTTQAASKEHCCDWCWQRIELGQQYKRYRAYSNGDVGTVKMHPECYDVMQGAAKQEGGWIEWTPGMERPAKGATA